MVNLALAALKCAVTGGVLLLLREMRWHARLSAFYAGTGLLPPRKRDVTGGRSPPLSNNSLTF